MSKEVEVKDKPTQAPYQHIAELRGGYYVLISHQELDYLVGSLMQMCDLTGDQEQRKALKNEIKQRTRRWLDSEYHAAGYQHYNLADGARVTKIED